MTAFRFEWVEKHLGCAPQTIFDVGTWDGRDAIAFKHNFPSARVVAFEACPDNHAEIVKHRLLMAEGVEYYHAAVREDTVLTAFFSNEDDHQQGKRGMSGSILAPTDLLKKHAPHLTFKQSRLVQGISLLDFCQGADIDRIDVLHMDVQGAEWNVLKGLGDLRPGMIFLETDETAESGHYEDARSQMQLFALRDSMGYQCVWDSGHDQLWLPKTP